VLSQHGFGILLCRFGGVCVVHGLHVEKSFYYEDKTVEVQREFFFGGHVSEYIKK